MFLFSHFLIFFCSPFRFEEVTSRGRRRIKEERRSALGKNANDLVEVETCTKLYTRTVCVEVGGEELFRHIVWFDLYQSTLERGKARECEEGDMASNHERFLRSFGMRQEREEEQVKETHNKKENSQNDGGGHTLYKGFVCLEVLGNPLHKLEILREMVFVGRE